MPGCGRFSATPLKGALQKSINKSEIWPLNQTFSTLTWGKITSFTDKQSRGKMFLCRNAKKTKKKSWFPFSGIAQLELPG